MTDQSSNFERKLQLTAQELDEFLDGAFPAAARPSIGRVALVELDHVRMRLDPLPGMTRPGNIISGPTLMSLIDGSAYAAVLAHIGRVEMAVTYNLNVTFLRACQAAPVISDARIVRLGRRLATVDVRLWQTSENLLIATSTVGYALP